MSARTGWVALAFVGVSWSGLVAAQTPAGGLSFRDVVSSVEDHHPRMTRETARVESAEGEFEAARGAFDPRASISGTSYPTGYYESLRLDVALEAPTPFYGLALSAGYRLTDGYVPVYDGRVETLDRGELRLGLRMPLLQDLTIDAARAGRTRAELDVGIADAQREAARLELLRLAAIAYHRWWAAGMALDVAERMLALAETRNGQIARMAAVGSLATIEARENERALAQRRARRIVAEQRLAEAAIQLSLYLRDENGRPRVAARSELPRIAPGGTAEVAPLDELLEDASAMRPELVALREQLERGEVAAELARNGRLPRLDARVGVSRDLGSGTEDQRTRLEETVVEAGLTISAPVPNRIGTGRARARAADVDGLEADLLFAQEQIATQVAEAHVAVVATERALELEREAFVVAEELARAEWRRFEEGSTTLLLVNLREQTAAESELAYVERRVELELARVRLALAVGARAPR